MIEIEFRYCDWPKCSLEAKHNIHFGNEQIWVCQLHQGAVIVNIESHGKIWIFKNKNEEGSDQPVVRPGSAKPLKKGQVARKLVPDPDWQQEAAKKADAAAVPVDIPTLITPRKRDTRQ